MLIECEPAVEWSVSLRGPAHVSVSVAGLIALALKTLRIASGGDKNKPFGTRQAIAWEEIAVSLACRRASAILFVEEDGKR